MGPPVLTWMALCCAHHVQAAEDAPSSLSNQNVVWDSPSANAIGSMPIGNGDMGLNAWVEPSGDLLFAVVVRVWRGQE